MKKILLSIPIFWLLMVVVLTIRATFFGLYVESGWVNIGLTIWMGVSIAVFLFWLADEVDLTTTSRVTRTYGR